MIVQDSSIIPIIAWLNLKRLSIYNNPISNNKSQKSSFIKSLLENTFKISIEWLQPISQSKPRVKVIKSKLKLDSLIHSVPHKFKNPDLFLTESFANEESNKILLPKLMPLPNIVQEMRLSCANNNEDDKMITLPQDESVTENIFTSKGDKQINQIGQNKIRLLRALKYAVDHPVTLFDRNVDLFTKTKSLPPKKTESMAMKKERMNKSDVISLILCQQNYRTYETEIPLNDALNMNVGQKNGLRSKHSKIAAKELTNMQRKYNEVRSESLKKKL